MADFYTATWYCSKNAGSIGSVDNRLKVGDVAIAGLHPKKLGKGKARFTYVKFRGKVYRVADRCDIAANFDIYQGVKTAKKGLICPPDMSRVMDTLFKSSIRSRKPM
jgi:hypothetical protein